MDLYGRERERGREVDKRRAGVKGGSGSVRAERGWRAGAEVKGERGRVNTEVEVRKWKGGSGSGRANVEGRKRK